MKVLILILVLASISFAQHGHTSGNGTADKPKVWLEDGLGTIDHPVSTKNAEAQKYFNQGLAYMYAFNHAEGINSFKHAAELDPNLAMAFWGIALGLGSNYNVTADEAALAEAYTNLQKAISLAPKASQAERDYIDALTKRYAKDPKADQKVLAANYRAAMGELVKKYPDDLDAATLYAESMMNLKPWQLWSLDGKPAEGTLEIISVLEGVLKRNPNHTGANHYYIHAVEASPSADRGLAAAMRLGGLAPNAGHLVHMPSHIYLRTGDWEEAVKSNDLAIEADRNYLQKSGNRGLYMMMYYNHNIHMLASSHAANGNYAGSIKAANDLATNIGPNVKAMPMLEMFMPYPIIANVRFHRWDEALAYPKPGEHMLTTIAHWHFARGMAFAEQKKTADAEKELAALRATAAKIPATAALFTTPVSVALKVADELLAGEIALSKGDRKGAITLMRQAAASEGKVNYAEPRDWDLPVREWLGRVLMMDGQYSEAEKAYREEIALTPRNGRALFGLAEALRKQGKTSAADLVQKEFEANWKQADTKLSANDLIGPSVRAAVPQSTSGNWKVAKVKLNTGVTLNYAEQGDPNGIPLIMLHGITDSLHSFSRMMPLMDSRYRVYTLDQRGHGDSDKPASGYEMKDFAADVVAFMDAKKIQKASIIGHSMGSFVALETAFQAPDRVDRLMLIGSATSAENEGTRELRKAFESLQDPIPVDFVREFQNGTVHAPLPDGFLDKVVAESMKVPARVWKAALAGCMSANLREKLPRITAPTLIIWGEKDTVFPRSEQDLLVSKLPKGMIQVYPVTGHSPNWEYPQQVVSNLKVFIPVSN